MSEAATKTDSPALPAPMPLSVIDVLRVARGGLIVSHVWVYLLPALDDRAQLGWNFWVGLFYVTAPLGLLIYGWNDTFDWDVDHASPRKNHPVGGAAFGPSLSRAQLASLPRIIALAQLPFALLWAASGHLGLVGWLALMALGNALYNGPGLRLSRVPVLAELTATGIYLLIAWLGVLIHSLAMPAWLWAFAALTILNLQVMGALVDVREDAEVGKRTFAVAFGRTASLAVVIASLLAKTGLTWAFTGHLPATAVALAGAVLVASGFSFGRVSRRSTAYNSFIVLDWIWLAMMFLR